MKPGQLEENASKKVSPPPALSLPPIRTSNIPKITSTKSTYGILKIAITFHQKSLSPNWGNRCWVINICTHYTQLDSKFGQQAGSKRRKSIPTKGVVLVLLAGIDFRQFSIPPVYLFKIGQFLHLY